MHIMPKIVEVRILGDYDIYIKYETGEEKVYNMERLIKNHKFYNHLSDKEKFKKIKIVGDIIEWETGEDISPEALYEDSISFSEYQKIEKA